MNKLNVVSCLIGLVFLFGLSIEAHAQHKGISFQAVMKRSDGTYPSVSGVTVIAQILDPINNCVLREEEHTGKNIANGYLNLVLGDVAASTPAARNPSPVLSISQVLDNKTTRTGLKCVDQTNNIVSSGQSYIPSNIDRRILRIRLNIQGEDIAADFNMRSVGFAVNSEMLNSKSDTDFLNVNNAKGVNQTNIDSIFERFTKLDAILNGFNAGGTAAGINITGNAATATSATNVTGTVAIANGGTGATDAATARTNLGLGSIATMSPTGPANSTTYLRGDGTWQTVKGGVDISDLGPLATLATSGTPDGTKFLRDDGRWTVISNSDNTKLPLSGGTMNGAINMAGNDLTDSGQITLSPQKTLRLGSFTNLQEGNLVSSLNSSYAGTTWFNSETGKVMYWEGGSAKALGTGAGNVSSISGAGPIDVDNTTPSAPIIRLGDLDASKVTTGTFPTSRLGTGTADGTKYLAGDGAWTVFPSMLTPTSNFSGDVGGTYNATSVDKIKGQTVTATATTAGQVLRYTGGNSWTPGFVAMTDLRSKVTGGNQFAGSCLSHQTLTYNSVGDVMQCASIAIANTQVSGLGSLAIKSNIDLSSAEVSGTLPAARMPAASGTADGLINQVAQSFSGLKTFLGGISVASLKVTGGAPTVGKVLMSDASGNATWQTVSGGARGYFAISSNYNIVAADVGKLLNVTNGSTVTLPDASVVGAGFFVSVKRTGVSDVTIGTTSAQTIDGQSSQTLQTQHTALVLVSTGSGWIIESKYGLSPALVSSIPSALDGLNATDGAAGNCQNITVINSGQIATSSLTVTPLPGFTTSGCTNNCSGQTLAGGASCTVGVKLDKNTTLGSITGGVVIAAATGGSSMVALSGTILSACTGTLTAPIPGTVCTGGAIYLGSLSPGAVSGSGTNKYMTTPGGCSDIPAGSVSGGGGPTSYANADFTPASCSGTDSLTKTWNDGSDNWFGVPGLSPFTNYGGTGFGASSTDTYYGSTNTTNIAAITSPAQGGYHAAARYCDKLVYGGYNDWYLPNNYELNLMWTNTGSIPGLNAGSYYWSSSELNNSASWAQRFSDGNRGGYHKYHSHLVRCVRRF